ncbi:unnamed protein product, partial [Mesorhabditis spiculigera]
MLQSTALMLLQLFFIAFELWWKYGGVEWPGNQVAYCIGNIQGIAEKSNIESVMTTIFEISNLLLGTLLVYLYHRQKTHQRSFDVSVNLHRRQLVHTMHLFMPYSVLHVICFMLFNCAIFFYRPLFKFLPEPYFSAGSGLCFFPMYFSAAAPWILWWIVGRQERKRQSATNLLILLEQQKADSVYFDNYSSQWGHINSASAEKPFSASYFEK